VSVPYAPQVLRGRDSERTAVVALLDEARASRGGALVLHGLPGVGKSMLLRDIADQARQSGDWQVLGTQGIESESPLAFAALHRLLTPAMGRLDALPGPQAQALGAAFGQVEGDADRFLVFLAALSLLSDLAGSRPVLAVVDDAHWLDEASAAALLFVARRLPAERVAVLFATREGDVRRFDSGDIPVLTLAGLDAAGTDELLAERAGEAVPAEVRDRLMQTTGGIPLALVELADALSTDQLTGLEPLPDHLPLTEGVERGFLDRARRLSDGAHALLLIAAADDSGRVTVVERAAAALGADGAALDEVERSGLLRVRDGQLELRHPLVRSAVYGAATSFERRRAHRVLADSLTGADEADRRAWHRAAAAEEPDESIVLELDAVAERAQRRGGLEAAASAWQRAAELTVAEDPRVRRLYAAARALWLAGKATRARVLADASHRGAADPLLRADTARLRSRIEWNTGSATRAHRMIMQGADEVAPFDPDRAREMAMFGAALASFGADSAVGISPVPFAAREQATSPRTRCFADLLIGLDHVAAGNWEAAAPTLRDAFELTDALDVQDQDLLPNFGIAAIQLGDDEASHRYHDLLLNRARDTGAMLMVLYSLTRRAFSDIATGRWGDASSAATEAVELAEGTGQPALQALPLAWVALLAALRGEEGLAERLGRAERLSSARATGIVVNVIDDVIRWARGLSEVGQPAVAFHHLAHIDHGIVRRMAFIDRVEAALRLDRSDTAEEWVGELDRFASATQQDWAAALAAHGQAALAAAAGDAGRAEELFEQALTCHKGAGHPFERARTQLAFGEHLRRSRRRVDARAQLRAALQTFQDLDAGPWVERATSELRASGETARKRDSSAVTELTPQELQVARLVSEGMSNRDAAAQLFLSPRTIDFHLRNVYAKLGVSSRAALAHLGATLAGGTSPGS
jgi:DNA-binding CsgD family transcriptional regulator